MESEKVEKVFVDCENRGFNPLFHTPYSDLSEYEGSPFEVIRRLNVDECDFEEVGPMWRIKFENGFETSAYPEEICKAAEGEGI